MIWKGFSAMRAVWGLMLLGVFAASVAAACDSETSTGEPSATTGTSSGGTGTGGSAGAGGEQSSCTDSTDCTTCKACAVETDCKAEHDACAADDACVELDACVSGCGDTLQCLGTCAQGFASGLQSYLALSSCIRCQSCTGFCEGCGLLHCVNGTMDGSESALDCGGPDCAGCPQGETCTTGDDCETGFCADGVCCDGGCSGTCESCVMASTGQPDGECHLIAGGSDPENECAADDVCNGAGDCQCGDGLLNFDESDIDCGGANCPGCANGDTCNGDGDCASGQCVDGVCCDSACGSTCESCLFADTGVADGTCAPITNGSDPDNECTQQSQSSCGTNGLCNGNGSCAYWPIGTACGSTQSCSGGIETKQDTCNGSGLCVDNGTVTCAPYPCSGNACLTSCTTQSQCQSGYYCNGTQCLPKKTNGTGCGGGVECISTFCTDGYCCNSACGGTCQSCVGSQTGAANGSCASVLAGNDPQNECAVQGPCGTTGVCSGSGSCQLFPSGTTCGSSPSCSGGVQTNQDYCSGTGSCVDYGTLSCGAYVCGATACLTSCSSHSQCISTHYCSGVTCTPKKAQGSACGTGVECSSGFCADGYCCNQACNGACMGCSQALSGAPNGTCNWFGAGADPQNECGACKYCNGAGACTNAPQGTNPKSLCPGCCGPFGSCGGTWVCQNNCGNAQSWGDCSNSSCSGCSNETAQCQATNGTSCDCPGQNLWFESGSCFNCGGNCPSCGTGYVCTQTNCNCQ